MQAEETLSVVFGDDTYLLERADSTLGRLGGKGHQTNADGSVTRKWHHGIQYAFGPDLPQTGQVVLRFSGRGWSWGADWAKASLGVALPGGEKPLCSLDYLSRILKDWSADSDGATVFQPAGWRDRLLASGAELLPKPEDESSYTDLLIDNDAGTVSFSMGGCAWADAKIALPKESLRPVCFGGWRGQEFRVEVFHVQRAPATSLGRRPSSAQAGSRMAQVHLTNQVIPREMLEQWEREADASMSGSSTARPCSLLLRGRCGPKSWREYVVAEHNKSGDNELLDCIGCTCCIPVFLLHLPFCCCAFPTEKPDMSYYSVYDRVLFVLFDVCCNDPWGERSCHAAFQQTLTCGWCASYCLGHFGCNEVSYHDWLHKEDERRRHREAYVAEKSAEYATLGLRGT